jgi:uncharacterized protein (UPF0332 family)
MSATDIDFLALAKAKITEAKSEPEFRCIVNRAYYGAYHYAINIHNLLPAYGTIPPYPAGTHEKLIYQLEHPSFSKQSSEQKYNLSISVGYILRGLKRIRSDADYDLSSSIGENEANNAIAQSESIFSKRLT